MTFISTENVTFLPRTAAKVAAALLVISTLTVTYQHDVRRQPQAKVFSEAEVFMQPQRRSLLVITPVLAAPVDVQRIRQAKWFQEPETFISPQRGYTLATLESYTAASASQFLLASRSLSAENAAWVKSQKGSLLVLYQQPIPSGPSDIFIGQDTYGWPPSSFEQDPFIKPQSQYSVVLNSAPVYNVANDVRRQSQGKWFTDPETFVSAQRWAFDAINTYPYNPNADVIWRRPQTKVFSDPEVFARGMPNFTGSALYNFTAYVPGHDVRRAIQGRWYTDAEVFGNGYWRAPFSQLLINGKAGTPPLDFANGLDIYDYLNGSLLLAWGAAKPTPQSYDIYQRDVTFTPGYQPPSGAFGPSVQAYTASFGPWVPSVAIFKNTLTAVISGLQIASYNASTQVVTPSLTYDIKVVAVINGAERGEVAKRVTPGPTSVMLKTAMKRLWPFPNTGLD